MLHLLIWVIGLVGLLYLRDAGLHRLPEIVVPFVLRSTCPCPPAAPSLDGRLVRRGWEACHIKQVTFLYRFLGASSDVILPPLTLSFSVYPTYRSFFVSFFTPLSLPLSCLSLSFPFFFFVLGTGMQRQWKMCPLPPRDSHCRWGQDV